MDRLNFLISALGSEVANIMFHEFYFGGLVISCSFKTAVPYDNQAFHGLTLKVPLKRTFSQINSKHLLKSQLQAFQYNLCHYGR